MAAIAALTLANGAATPVNHTFSPAPDFASSLARWEDRVDGIALGYPVVSMVMRRPTKASRSYKVTAKVVLPVLEVTSPATGTGIDPGPTLSYNLIANVDFVLPERSSLAERKNLLAYFKNFVANAVMTSAIQDFEPVY